MLLLAEDNISLQYQWFHQLLDNLLCIIKYIRMGNCNIKKLCTDHLVSNCFKWSKVWYLVWFMILKLIYAPKTCCIWCHDKKGTHASQIIQKISLIWIMVLTLIYRASKAFCTASDCHHELDNWSFTSANDICDKNFRFTKFKWNGNILGYHHFSVRHRTKGKMSSLAYKIYLILTLSVTASKCLPQKGISHFSVRLKL